MVWQLLLRGGCECGSMRFSNIFVGNGILCNGSTLPRKALPASRSLCSWKRTGEFGTLQQSIRIMTCPRTGRNLAMTMSCIPVSFFGGAKKGLFSPNPKCSFPTHLVCSSKRAEDEDSDDSDLASWLTPRESVATPRSTGEEHEAEVSKKPKLAVHVHLGSNPVQAQVPVVKLLTTDNDSIVAGSNNSLNSWLDQNKALCVLFVLTFEQTLEPCLMIYMMWPNLVEDDFTANRLFKILPLKNKDIFTWIFPFCEILFEAESGAEMQTNNTTIWFVGTLPKTDNKLW